MGNIYFYDFCNVLLISIIDNQSNFFIFFLIQNFHKHFKILDI